MQDSRETIYQGQEFFRIIHEGARAGLYRVEVLPTGEEKETQLGGPLRASVIERDGGKALLLEWRDPSGEPHAHVIPAMKICGGRIPLPILPMVDGGWDCFILNQEKRRMFRRFLVAAWNTECRENGEQVQERQR